MGAVVVFGATGGVGRHAVAQLLGAGQDVIAVVRDHAKGTPLANAGVRVVTHDLRHDDPWRLARHLKGADSVLFAAGVHYGAPRRTAAEVPTMTKREMPVIPAPEVQDVWTGEFGWVAIGCAKQQIEVIAGSNCRLADFQIFGRAPECRLGRPVESK